MKRSIAALAAAAALFGCHPSADDVAPTDERKADAQAAPTQAKRITIDADGLDREQIREIAEHIEGIGDIASAKVQVKQDDKGHSEVLVEIAGADLPSDDYLLREIRTFEGLAAASVDVQSVHPDEVAPEPMYIDKTKTPEQIKAEVIEQLRRDGVEGNVVVTVHDDGDGERRVEVSVEATEDEDVPAKTGSDKVAAQAD